MRINVKKIKMTLRIVMVIIFCVFYNSRIIFPQEIPSSSSSEEIILKAIDAHGGEEALRRLENKNNYTLETSLYSPTGEFFGTFTLNFKKPDKIREEVYLILQNLFITRIYNAGRIYITADGKKVEDMTEISRFEKASQLRIKTGLLVLLYLLDHQGEVTYIGEELVNGRRCFVLEIFLEKDTRSRYFFDAETFLLSKSVRTISDTKSNTETTVYYYDFEKVEGVNFPFRMEVYQDGNKISKMIVSKISFEELADSLFEIP